MAIYNTSKYGQSEYGSQAAHPYLNVTGKLIWLIQIDWDRDGSFGVEIEPQTIVDLKFKRGRSERILSNGQGQEQPDQETFWLLMDDPTARYDSFNQASPLYNYLGTSGMLVRFLVISTTSDARDSAFVGVLTSATYDVNTQRATLTGEGCSRMLEIGDAEHLYNECQPTNQLNLAGWDSYFTLDVGNTPYPVNWWRGRVGGLALSECVRLTLDAAEWLLGMYSGQVAYSTDYPNYFYLDGSSGWSTLKDLADAFAARLFFMRDGRLFVMDRQDFLGLSGSTNPFGSPLLSYGLNRPSPYAMLRNQAVVQVRPHAASGPYRSSHYNYQLIEAWSNTGPIDVEPLSTLELDIEYLHDGKIVVGSYVISNAGFVTDGMEVWSNVDKTGTDLFASGDTSLAPLNQGVYGFLVPYGNQENKTRIQFVNDHPTLTAYFFNAKILILGIRETGNSAVVTVKDDASIALNGKRVLEINSRWVQRSNLATSVAQSYVDALSSREKASPVTLAYSLSGDALYNMLSNYDLGSRVDFGLAGGTISLDNFGLRGVWLIVGIDLDWINPDGQDAIVKVTYEKITAAQVTLAGLVSTTTANTSASVVWAHTVPSGLNRLLVVEVGLRAFQTVTGVTFGSQSLTKAGAVQYAAGNYARAEIWYLVAPAVGTDNVTVTISGAEVVEAAALNFVNVNQTSPMGTFASNSDLGGSEASVNVVSDEGDLVIDLLVKDGGTLAAGAEQTSLWAVVAAGSWNGSGSSEPGVATGITNMSWNLTGANAWALGAVAIKGV